MESRWDKNAKQNIWKLWCKLDLSTSGQSPCDHYGLRVMDLETEGKRESRDSTSMYESVRSSIL